MDGKMNKLPNDWKRQIIEAKVEHDKHGVVATYILVPKEWAEDMMDGVVSGKNKDIYMINHNLNIYGADLLFGPVDSPVCGSTVDM